MVKQGRGGGSFGGKGVAVTQTGRRGEGGSRGKSGLTQTAEVAEATLIVAHVWSTTELKESENRFSTSPGDDGGNKKEEGRTKKAENSASSLYNCLNATGIAFIQLKHSLSLYIWGGAGGEVGGVAVRGVGGREIRQ